MMRVVSPGETVDSSARECAAAAEKIGLLGQSAPHRRLISALHRAAQFDAEVFLIGETGVGKELYSRYIHESSARADGEFIAVNCGAIPDSLFENELFGHSAGAYTDAKTRSEGLVAAADGGTLFLDEIDGLPKTGQVKLLRLLQEKEYRRLGETRLRRANIRVISAMNRNPAVAIEEGALREDLFYRLYVNPEEIPPLRDRPEDVSLLLDHFARRYSSEYGRCEALDFSAGARRLLCAYHWPGNVRQLENVIRSLACQQPAASVEADDLPIARPQESAQTYTTEHLETLLSVPFSEAKRLIVEQFEVDYIQAMLRRTNGNINHASKLAGKNRRAFFELIRKHHIVADDFRSDLEPDAR